MANWNYIRIKNRIKKEINRDGITHPYYGYLGDVSLYSCITNYLTGKRVIGRGSEREWRIYAKHLNTGRIKWPDLMSFFYAWVDMEEYQKTKINGMLAAGWRPHPETTPDKIDEKYKVKLKNGKETEDYFTGFNWYYYDYTEIVAWKSTM